MSSHNSSTCAASQTPAPSRRLRTRKPAIADISERILTLFEQMGLRSTRPRRLIAERLAALGARGADFTAQELWQDIQERDPGIGRATVYRAVDVLLSQGLLDRVAFADGTHRYRLCGVSHHHHMTCTQCQRVVEVDACLPSELLASIAQQTDFAIEGHSLELFGRCAACRKSQESSVREAEHSG